MEKILKEEDEDLVTPVQQKLLKRILSGVTPKPSLPALAAILAVFAGRFAVGRLLGLGRFYKLLFLRLIATEENI